MQHYANVVDLTELDTVARMIVGDWVDSNTVRTLDEGRADGDYVLVVGDDDEQVEARADILSERFGVRVRERASD